MYSVLLVATLSLLCCFFTPLSLEYASEDVGLQIGALMSWWLHSETLYMEPSYKVDHSEVWRVPECFRTAGASELIPVQGKPCLSPKGWLTLSLVYF